MYVFSSLFNVYCFRFIFMGVSLALNPTNNFSLNNLYKSALAFVDC